MNRSRPLPQLPVGGPPAPEENEIFEQILAVLQRSVDPVAMVKRIEYVAQTIPRPPKEVSGACWGGCGRVGFTTTSDNATNICDECSERAKAAEKRRDVRRGLRPAYSRAYAAGLPATLTDEQWNLTLDQFDNLCAYCGGDWHVVEHATPIKLGGGTTWNNCVPACHRCNTAKSSKTLEAWLGDKPTAAMPWTAPVDPDRVRAAITWLAALPATPASPAKRLTRLLDSPQS